MATNPNLVNATAGQRLAARAVDSVPLLVLALVVLTVPGQLSMILCAVGAAAYLLWVWLWEAGRGQTPGNRLLGLRTVGEDGQAPGFPAALARNLLLLASGVTVVGPWILTVSNLWDHPNRRQGWHDKAARTLMVDVRAGRDPLATGGRWIQGAPGHEQPDVPGPAPVPAAASAAFAAASVRSAAAPVTPAAGHAEHIGASSPAPERTNWLPAPDQPVGPGPISSVPGAPVRSPGGTAQDPAPAPAAAGPAADVGEEEDDVEMTRVVSRPRSAGRLLTFDDGATVRVAGTALLGRNPAAGIGESADQLIDFADMGRSVSKTHLHLQTDGSSGLWVTDRNSTNGSSIVAPDGRHVALEAHSPVLAPTGSTVYFGDRHFTIA